MKLSQLIEFNLEEEFRKQLLKMTCFFQENLWNGYDDENDPKFISTEDFEGIEALTDKITHMILNIGCPNSVEPMLYSIASRKIKHWQAGNNVESENVIKYIYNTEKQTTEKKITRRGFGKGRQLKTCNDLDKVYNATPYYKNQVQDRVISGHFRWNNRGYILSRRCTDLILYYLTTEF